MSQYAWFLEHGRMEKDWKSRVLEQLRSSKDQDSKTIFIGHREYSIRELIEEVERDTETGRELVKLHSIFRRHK